MAARTGNDLQALERLRRLIRRLALLIGVVTAVSIPLGYLGLAYRDQAEELSFQAELTALRLARHIDLQGPTWYAAQEQLDMVIAGDRPRSLPLLQSVGLPDGRVVLRQGVEPAWPSHAGSGAILVQDERVGVVTVEGSLRPLLLNTALLALFSLALGGGAYLAFYLLPLRALERNLLHLRETLETLEANATETIYAYEELKRQHRLVEETTHELMKARDEALTADRAKSAFLATMSHELRTPLNAIIGFSEVLTLGIFGPLANDRYRDYCQAIGDSGRHLLAVINDVLDISKIEAGKLQLHFEEIDLEKLLRGCCALVRAKVDESGIGLDLEPADPALSRLWVDPVKLKQIVLNLLTNALKFTPSGGNIRISMYQEPGALAFSIADSGIGMSASDVKLALQPFQQVENSHSRRYEGTGLGLPLAKALVEQHGGRLEIDSTPGRGTTVTVLLPEHGRPDRTGSEDRQGRLDLQSPDWLGRRSA